MDNSRAAPRWASVVAFSAVLLVAAGLRLHRLSELPLGLHYDEAANGILAGEIARGVKAPIFIAAYTGKEVLFFYWAALWMRLLDITPLALRFAAATAGTATVVATVWMTYELLHDEAEGLWIALVAAGLLAVSFWHLVLSRYGFRAITQPLFQALTVGALWRGLRSEKRGWLALAGLLCGLTAYTYLAARAFPVPLAAALLVFLIPEGGRRRARALQLTVFVGVAALVLSPLAHYWLTHPGSFMVRTRQVAADTWSEMWQGLLACFKMFFWSGDPYIRFNLPGRPLFLPGTAALWLVGLGASALQLMRSLRAPGRGSWRLSAASHTLLLVSVPVTLLPSALATGEVTPSNLRTVGLLPFLYVFPALGLSALKSAVERAAARVGRGSGEMRGSWALGLLLVVLVLALGGPATADAYFRDWGPADALYDAADGDMVDVADYLNRSDLSAMELYVASAHYRHPTLAFLAEDYDEVRWLVEGRTLVFPADGEALLVYPRSAAEGLEWVESMLPGDALAAAPPGPDGAPGFHAYQVKGLFYPAPARSISANFGHVVRLLGYEVTAPARPGDGLEIAVWWEVLGDPHWPDYRPVLRLVDDQGFLWAESEPIHYPSEQWLPDQVVVDHVPVSIPVAAAAPPGDYNVRFGFYSPGGDARLPVLDEAGAYAGTYVDLPVRLGRTETAPRVEDLAMGTYLDVEIEGLELLGATLATPTVRPGERVYVTLFWRADQVGLSSHPVSLTLGDRVLYRGDPVHGTYPFGDWVAGEVVSDRYGPRVPLETAPGEHPLQVQVAGTRVDLGGVTVQETERRFEVPSMSHALGVTLGDRVELLGYDISADSVAPGETVLLTLYWRPLVEMTRDYTVFVHLRAPDGSMTGQQDNQPVGGSRPTSLWFPGEVVTDHYEIPVDSDAMEGEHRLEGGMYVAETGERLSVEGVQDNAVGLQVVTVTE